MKRIFQALLLAFALLAVGCGKAPEEESQLYYCPMHPHYTSEHEGACPICGMDLVPAEKGYTPAPQATQSRLQTEEEKKEDRGRILYYRHPMGLPDTSPVPKKDSMGMDYIPVYEGDIDAGLGAVAVAPEMIQSMGVRTASVRMETFGRTARAFGAIEASTRLETTVSARVEGWVEALQASAVGDEVAAGDLLFRLYSPDLIAAQQDYLAALRAGGQERIASAARRLRSLGLDARAIEAIRETGRVEERAPVYAPRDGVVAALDIREGGFVKPGDRLLALQNYEEVWIIAALAEQDLAMIRPGQPVEAVVAGDAGARRAGVVDYVYPTVDPETRTGRARIVLANDDGVLKPGALADVTIAVDARPRLAVPSEAVLRDSRGAHVIRALGEGRFAPIAVETGVVAAGFTEIVSGLSEGDEIVVSGQFLIDSESSLRESLRKLTAPEADESAAHLQHEHGGGH
ncbi:efflux RND transporter periplasmic adaptor subunit [Amphiplicatus metriothermophilus]|uniref:RND family efflux transporter, MFP subunit n=1 Tax=Amphiplicatus metriothermophilus TaxID=1519374 RepID=A0A239PQD9_9PROT|nr:efflux RND transporter periplasmic adaptor subunit [Amphiplicatus metriothermophilus]MBB5518900.1 RND family efflux transporter MFP subunit [Amphiplicatus metriothermophilus]SNT71947.1 RND family efflux transporter, MFP subunit [Amphiplicatus metriothermophilus]